MLNDLYKIIVHLNSLTHPLRELLHKEVDFHWTGICNEAFGKLKLCIKSDNRPSIFDDPPFARL